MPESPRYLMAAGRYADALEELRRAARINGTKLPPGILIKEPKVCV